MRLKLYLEFQRNCRTSFSLSRHIQIPWGGGRLGLIVGSSGCPHSCYSCFMLLSGMHSCLCLFSQPLTIPAPWVILHIGWSVTSVSTLVSSSYFLAGNRKAELKLTTFSSLLLFCVFVFSSSSTPSL